LKRPRIKYKTPERFVLLPDLYRIDPDNCTVFFAQTNRNKRKSFIDCFPATRTCKPKNFLFMHATGELNNCTSAVRVAP